MRANPGALVGTVVGTRVRIPGEKRLSARFVATAPEGYHADGSGLYLQVSASGARSWIYRFQLRGKRREMGLGSATLLGLAEARDALLQVRRQVAAGIDPIDARAAGQRVQGKTWGDYVDAMIDSLRPSWRNPVQADQWEHSLREYGPARELAVASVTTAVAVDRLRAIWTTKTETATRVRSRCERVWDYARVSGAVVAGENPFRWRGHLDKLLPPPAKVAKTQNFAAMPYPALPAFVPALRARKGLSARALEFTILTAARTGEVIGAHWREFDLEAKLWTLPGDRMKSGNEHVVPLTDRAVEILAALPRRRPPFPLSENAMLYLLQRPLPKGLAQPVTVHGFRSTFSDWAHETTAFPNHVIEMALAHAIKDKAEAAYRRGALLDKRRELMQAWADYCAPSKGSSRCIE